MVHVVEWRVLLLTEPLHVLLVLGGSSVGALRSAVL